MRAEAGGGAQVRAHLLVKVCPARAREWTVWTGRTPRWRPPEEAAGAEDRQGQCSGPVSQDERLLLPGYGWTLGHLGFGAQAPPGRAWAVWGLASVAHCWNQAVKKADHHTVVSRRKPDPPLNLTLKQ